MKFRWALLSLLTVSTLATVRASTPREGAGVVSRGERVDPARFGRSYVESMAEVVRRNEEDPRRDADPRSNPELRFGQWKVPSRRATSYPKSGVHHAVNTWGDTRMGITFPMRVDLHGAWFAGQQASGVWTTGVMVIGYADGEEVGRTGWFREIDDTPDWFEMALCGVDRIEVVSEAVVQGGGWYGMDDLTWSPADDESAERIVVDFEDLSFNTTLSGGRYAGLTWEFGTGYDDFRGVDAPQIPPGRNDKPEPGEGGAEGGVSAVAGGTLPALLDSFEGVLRGDAGSFSFPPDTCGAVGPDHYAIAVNRNFAVYDKDSGAELINVHLGSFLPGSNGDPRILFDHHSGRWIVLATDFSGGSNIYLAVSLTDDATGSWFKTSFFTAQGTDAGKWPDYPTLGVDANGIYTCAFMVGGSNNMTIFAIDKAPLIAGSPSLGTVTAFRNLTWEGAIQPAHTYGDPGGQYFLSTSSSTSLRLRRVEPPLTSPTLTQLGFFEVESYQSPPDAPALDSDTNVSTIDRRLMMAVYRDGSLWASHTVSFNGRASCRWYELDPATLEVVQYGTVASEFRSYYFPSIMVNGRGNVAMGFSASSPTEYIGAFYTGRRNVDPPGEMAPAVVYRAGSGAQNNIDQYGRNRWGDYSYTTLDPADDTTFYTLQAYAASNNIWGTYIGVVDGGDCNANGIDDDCDISCGGACDVPGCGGSIDCNFNGLPDDCEQATGACCLPDGSCCNLTPVDECETAWGTFYGLGTTCDDILDPPCEPASARLSCSVDLSQAVPGGIAAVDVYVEGVTDLATYQVSLEAASLTGPGNLALDCGACTGPSNEPDCALRIDEQRSDFIFTGENGLAAVSCDIPALGGVLLSGSVTVDDTPAYGGTYYFDIPANAEVGDQYEVSVNTSQIDSFLVQTDGTYLPYQLDPPCVVTVVEEVVCEAPTVVAEGSRTLLVTPTTQVSQALRVTGSAGDTAVSCVDLYVQADGTLGPTAFYQAAGAWGTVAVRGDALIPDATYEVRADCGSMAAPQLSSSAAGTTWVWGDVEAPPNGTVNFGDIFLVVQAFQQVYNSVTLERADLEPCTPNQTVNFADIQQDVQAFQGQTYAQTGCPLPCP